MVPAQHLTHPRNHKQQSWSLQHPQRTGISAVKKVKNNNAKNSTSFATCLIPEDSEAFFQRELKPVSARNPIACPVVEIFVADDALNAEKIVVSGCLREGQNIT